MADKSVEHLGEYWDSIADVYNDAVSIITSDFHYGPLVPGDSELQLLPKNISELRCLEIGAGAGQNSIYLAKQGASCLATDISDKQLEHGIALAEKEQVQVAFECLAMEDLCKESHGTFDIIHSSYAITFSPQPAAVVAEWANMLKPGGTLLLSTGHPLFTGEWLELDEEQGLYITDYFKPQPDIRYDDDGVERVRSNFYSISDMSDWFYNAGLLIERVVEPQPLTLDEIPEEERRHRVPYYSNGWAEYYEQLSKVPGLIIFKCRKIL